MSRRKRVLKRPPIAKDKNFNSILVSKLINRVMLDGKKTIANRIVHLALLGASQELQMDPVHILETVIENVKPQIEVKSMRVGGATYQVPMEPYPERGLSLSLRWIVWSARDQKGKSMSKKLQDILIQSINNEGPAIEKRKKVEQTAAGNKAFAHLAIWAKRRKENGK
jgi:small subunit ribosomal protein S7